MENIKQNQDRCPICGSPHFIKIDSNEYQCENCGFLKVHNEELSEEKILVINAYSILRQGNYVDAEEAFDDILNKNKNNYEALWGKICSHHGIVFVEDNNKIYPTFHDIVDINFLEEEGFKRFLSICPEKLKEVYINLAKRIEDLRDKYYKQVIKEKSYDIFISFKASDEKGSNIKDYIEATNLHSFLVGKGYKVFFSPVSLKDKTANEYEPYIYHALRTAKVMIVYGQKEEYFEAKWLKNEWGRFIRMIDEGIKEDGSLIVCYENMSPNNLPNRLKKLQCLNLSDKTSYIILDKVLNKLINNKEAFNLSKIKMLVDVRKDYLQAEENIYEALEEDYDNYDLWYYYLKSITKGFKDNSHESIEVVFYNLFRLVTDDRKEELSKLDSKLNPVTIKQLEEEKNKVRNYKTGDIIEFGSYPQTIKADNVTITNNKKDVKGYYTGSDGEKYALLKANPSYTKNEYSSDLFSNGEKIVGNKEYYFKVEPIKWKVLEDKDGKAFLFSKLLLDSHRFDDSSNDYSISSIRSWLNNEFYNRAFTDKQKELIENTTLKDILNTTDKVFLLSKDEITNEFFGFSSDENKQDKARCKNVTDYAKANYAYEYEENKNGWYYLRTPYYSGVFHILTDGEVFRTIISYDHSGVAPALYIDKTKL